MRISDWSSDVCSSDLIDRMQCRDGAVRIDWKQDSRGVAHLAEQRFADGRILVRLLVLAVLPRVRGDDEWDRNPARLLADLALAPREHDLLAQAPEHLHRERFIAHDQVEPALVGERGTGDRKSTRLNSSH